jgi:arylsulfatase A-like enzyme
MVAPPEAPPIVILYVLDALRADALEAVDGDGKKAAPTLLRLAREGVSFARHQSVAPNTLPSTKALFTGRTNRRKGALKLPDQGVETLAEAFARAGYRTGSFSGNTHISPVAGLTRGFQHVAQEAFFDLDEAEQVPFNNSAEIVHTTALGWLDALAPEEKAFLYLHTVHPHNPYDPPEPILERFTRGVGSEIAGTTSTLLAVQHHRHEVSAADRERLSRLYHGGLAYNDQEIGRFLEELGKRFRPQDVLVIFTSDHGEELFDHGGVLHGYTLYREQLEIPLILWWPGALEPQHIESPTTTLDLHESLRHLLGLTESPERRGRSFWPLLSRASERIAERTRFAAASSLKGGVFSAQSDRYKLILAPRTGSQWGMGEGLGRTRDMEYVFDLVHDPLEKTNLAGHPSLEIAWLRSRLLAWIDAGHAWEEKVDQPLELDEESRRNLEALGYVEGPDG